MAGKHTFQAPKGTRDFYPADMAVRRHIENVWRDVSINHGFEEIDGPTFEHLDLYTVKSGPGIVSELFSFKRAGGDTDYALRPEFTPTLARMVAARAAELPKPIKWFCMPNFFRAERPQRGRLREFMQWNADILGDDSPRADAEIIAVTIGLFERFGLPSQDVTVKLSHRELVTAALSSLGVVSANHEKALALLDKKAKLPADEFAKQAGEIDLDVARFNVAIKQTAGTVNTCIAAMEQGGAPPADAGVPDKLLGVLQALADIDVLRWCEFDMSIVRGLAYYTGTVFEVHEATGKERAIAGGGRYDKLVELFGGPPTPAVGIAMGDVVLSLVLQDKGLLKPAEEYLPRPDVFVIAADESVASELPKLVAALRREGLHARHSYKTTRNVGKLLGDASKVHSRFALILGKELAEGVVALKNLATGEQRDIKRDDLMNELRAALRESE
jgi:histidyl-tRNA synthetase